MDANLGHVLFYSVIGGVISMIGGVLLLRKKETANKLVKYATPFAGGALLAAVFLDLLKEAIEVDDVATVMYSALVGIVVFFLAEGFLHWFHHHHEHEKGTRDTTKSLIVVGDTIHNAIDGVALGAAFLISLPTGIVTTIAVAAHELPQEIGDFGLLLSKGMERAKVLLVNILSALATVIAAVLVFQIGSEDSIPLGVLLGVSSGFLLYIAMSDVIPTIHAKKEKSFNLQAFMLILGVIIVGAVTTLAHDYIEEENGHTHGSSEMKEVRGHDEEDHEEDKNDNSEDDGHDGEEDHHEE